MISTSCEQRTHETNILCSLKIYVFLLFGWCLRNSSNRVKRSDDKRFVTKELREHKARSDSQAYRIPNRLIKKLLV